MVVTKEEFEDVEKTKKLDQDIIDNIKKSIVPTKRLLKDGKPVMLSNEENLSIHIRCYPYALGIMYNEFVKSNGTYGGYLNYEPGFTYLTNVEPRRFLTELMELVRQDLENLKIKYREIPLNGDISLKQGEYLIKVFIKEPKWNGTMDYHFVRYSPKEKVWFHKMSYFPPEVIDRTAIADYYRMTVKFEENSIYLKEPEKIIANHGVYEPLGYFAIEEP